jgi:hypothetical protein
MIAHELKKIEERWTCEICHQKWKTKPRTNCPGIEVYKKIPNNLATEEGLASLNLKPTGEPVGCTKKNGEWVSLYESSESEIADQNLPPLYTWENRPNDLQTPNQLYRYNRKPGEKIYGCVWSKEGWVYLYKWQECPIKDESLPPYVGFGVQHNLKTEGELKKENLVIGDAPPRGFYRVWDKGWTTIFLYDPKECKWEAPDHYITKGKLQSAFELSDSWVKRLGKPDLICENPHYKNSNPMLLYSTKRVTNFLADHAEEYAIWLDKREKYVAIFEVNKEVIAEGRNRYNQIKRKQKEKDNEFRNRRRQQTQECLKCASGCATNNGFICAVYPMGLDDSQIPCIDFVKREWS